LLSKPFGFIKSEAEGLKVKFNITKTINLWRKLYGEVTMETGVFMKKLLIFLIALSCMLFTSCGSLNDGPYSDKNLNSSEQSETNDLSFDSEESLYESDSSSDSEDSLDESNSSSDSGNHHGGVWTPPIVMG